MLARVLAVFCFLGLAFCLGGIVGTVTHKCPPSKSDCDTEHKEHMQMMGLPRCKP